MSTLDTKAITKELKIDAKAVGIQIKPSSPKKI